jgi:hypothetical protein
MLGWLYDIFVTIVSFIMGLLGFDLTKRSVTFAEGTKEESVDDATTTTKNESNVVAEESKVAE